jgi:hypothetical protein
MATTRTVRGTEVKLRRPWGIFALTLLTFGVYYISGITASTAS